MFFGEIVMYFEIILVVEVKVFFLVVLYNGFFIYCQIFFWGCFVFIFVGFNVILQFFQVMYNVLDCIDLVMFVKNIMEFLVIFGRMIIEEYVSECLVGRGNI